MDDAFQQPPCHSGPKQFSLNSLVNSFSTKSPESGPRTQEDLLPDLAANSVRTEKSRYPSKLISSAWNVAPKLIGWSDVIGSTCSGSPSWQRPTSISPACVSTRA